MKTLVLRLATVVALLAMTIGAAVAASTPDCCNGGSCCDGGACCHSHHQK